MSAGAFYKRLTAVSHEVFLASLRDTTRSLAASPLMVRIGWYLERPDPRRSLRQWILAESPSLMLKKLGVRKRRATSLPPAVLEQIDASDPPCPDSALAPRAVRQGKPQPRSGDAPIVEGRLS